MPCTKDLLQQIASNTAKNSSAWIAAISGAAGVFGALAGALLTYLSARKTEKSQVELETARLRATLVTTERLRWLQDIRQRVSKIYREADMQYSLLKRPVTPEDLPQLQQKLDEMSSEVMEQSNIVILMLNPDKEDQYNLQTALQDTLKFLSDCFQKKTPSNDRFNDQNYGDLKNNAFNALTKIGILSWDRIQKLE